MPPEIAQACALTERKCTACHDRERFLEARHAPDQWQDIVDQMRRIPGSGITRDDAKTVLQCLNYRSSVASYDMHPAPAMVPADVVALTPRYVSRRGEVQALHCDLHNRLHSVELGVLQRSVSPR